MIEKAERTAEEKLKAYNDRQVKAATEARRAFVTSVTAGFDLFAVVLANATERYYNRRNGEAITTED